VHQDLEALRRQHPKIGVEVREEPFAVFWATERAMNPGDVLFVIVVEVRVVRDQRENAVETIHSGPDDFLLPTDATVGIAVPTKSFTYGELIAKDPGEVSWLDPEGPLAFELLAACHFVDVRS
jgi:hypothetical protein